MLTETTTQHHRTLLVVAWLLLLMSGQMGCSDSPFTPCGCHEKAYLQQLQKHAGSTDNKDEDAVWLSSQALTISKDLDSSRESCARLCKHDTLGKDLQMSLTTSHSDRLLCDCYQRVRTFGCEESDDNQLVALFCIGKSSLTKDESQHGGKDNSDNVYSWRRLQVKNLTAPHRVANGSAAYMEIEVQDANASEEYVESLDLTSKGTVELTSILILAVLALLIGFCSKACWEQSKKRQSDKNEAIELERCEEGPTDTVPTAA